MVALSGVIFFAGANEHPIRKCALFFSLSICLLRLATGSSPVSQRNKEFTRLSAARQRVGQRLPARQGAPCNRKFTRLYTSATRSSLVSQRDMSTEFSVSQRDRERLATGSSRVSQCNATRSSLVSRRDREFSATGSSRVSSSQRDKEFTRLSARQRVQRRPARQGASRQEVYASPKEFTRLSALVQRGPARQGAHPSPSATESSPSSEGTLSCLATGSSPARQGIHSSLSAIESSSGVPARQDDLVQRD